MNDLKITVDYRETASGLTDLLKNSGVLVKIEKLSYGDYITNNTITVERKTAKDFLISIIDGRLFNQLSNLKKFCNHPILLIEGNLTKLTIILTEWLSKALWFQPKPYGMCLLSFLTQKKIRGIYY